MRREQSGSGTVPGVSEEPVHLHALARAGLAVALAFAAPATDLSLAPRERRRPALRDAVRSRDGAHLFAEGLFDCLHGGDDAQRAFEAWQGSPYLQYCERVPSPQPLQGLRIVDLTRVLAGPFCTMLLADRGAEVIKVEEPGLGDEIRGWSPSIEGWGVYFLGVNRNKKSVAVDLKTESGANTLWRLLRTADVLVENFRPGSLAQLGFSPDAIRERNPRLIHCSISGYGLTGPRSGEAGYDPVIQAESGMMDNTGMPDGPAMRMAVAMTDYLAGLYAVQAILLALMDREKTGLGQLIDISLYDTLLSTLPLQVGSLQATGTVPHRQGNDHPAIAPYEVLRARDADIMVAAANPRLWRRLCEAIGATELIDDPRYATNAARLANRQSLKQALEAAFQRMPTAELLDRLRAASVPCGPIRTIADAIADPQVAARHSLVEFPEIAGGFKVPANAVRFSRIPAPDTRRPPRLGEHTREVLEALGLDTASTPS